MLTLIMIIMTMIMIIRHIIIIIIIIIIIMIIGWLQNTDKHKKRIMELLKQTYPKGTRKGG